MEGEMRQYVPFSHITYDEMMQVEWISTGCEALFRVSREESTVWKRNNKTKISSEFFRIHNAIHSM